MFSLQYCLISQQLCRANAMPFHGDSPPLDEVLDSSWRFWIFLLNTQVSTGRGVNCGEHYSTCTVTESMGRIAGHSEMDSLVHPGLAVLLRASHVCVRPGAVRGTAKEEGRAQNPMSFRGFALEVWVSDSTHLAASHFAYSSSCAGVRASCLYLPAEKQQ
jgi:hypothetical protein